jgi:hypothetical protein
MVVFLSRPSTDGCMRLVSACVTVFPYLTVQSMRYIPTWSQYRWRYKSTLVPPGWRQGVENRGEINRGKPKQSDRKTFQDEHQSTAKSSERGHQTSDRPNRRNGNQPSNRNRALGVVRACRQRRQRQYRSVLSVAWCYAKITIASRRESAENRRAVARGRFYR